ncbi:hypothetical protein AB4851_01725 [Burkholderia sp. 22PA0099]|uniref:hypothetical protein n=1 Tax=Burkholderia sp. 22PA0099 TaxID=3237372 RepID=UPI0039C03CAC
MTPEALPGLADKQKPAGPDATPGAPNARPGSRHRNAADVARLRLLNIASTWQPGPLRCDGIVFIHPETISSIVSHPVIRYYSMKISFQA